MNSERNHAQQLLNHLAPEQVAAVVHLMEVMLDPLARKLAAAPPEDEVISLDEELAVEEGRQSSRQNKSVSHADVLADFGLTLNDFQKMAACPPDDSRMEKRQVPVD